MKKTAKSSRTEIKFKEKIKFDYTTKQAQVQTPAVTYSNNNITSLIPAASVHVHKEVERKRGGGGGHLHKGTQFVSSIETQQDCTGSYQSEENHQG